MGMMPPSTTLFKVQIIGFNGLIILWVLYPPLRQAINFVLAQNNQKIGAVNTAYTVGAIIAGWFFGGPLADLCGRRWGMAIGCFLTIIATFIQTFAPKGNLGVFIAGRVIIGIGQGIALS
jgi:MFS family permease